ncbi:phage tail length tape measure family protein [Nitrobacteraceae bacterium UC4446_H13]
MADLEQLVLTISADTRQMQRALAKLTGDVKSAGDGLDKAFKAPKVDDVAKSLNKTRFETANLAAQFQDIAVQLQGGSSPFTIALQQGTQISQVLGQRGAGGVVSLLGSAFTSLLSPVSLATIGIIAFGGAAVQYGAKAIGAIDDLDDKLKAHAELIKLLKDAYGEAGKGVDLAMKESVAVLKTLLGLNTAELQKQFTALARTAVVSMSSFETLGDAVGITIESTAKKFAAFKGPIDDLREGLKSGTPDVKGFREAVAQIEQSSADEKVKKLAQQLLDSTDSAAKAELAINGTAKAMRNLTAEALAATEQGEAFAKALKSLGSTVSPNLSDREKIMKNYGAALDKAGSTEERLAAARARDDQLAVLSSNERKKAAEDAAKSAESAQKRFESAINSTTKRSAGLEGQIAGIGKGVGELTRLETQYRLTEAAQQAFGKVTPEIAAKIDAVAASAGKAADALARAKLSFQIGQDSQTALLTPEDAAIAKQLSQTLGTSVPDALKSSYAETIRWNEALRGVSSTMSSTMTSGLADILDGTKSASDGFAAMGKTIVRSLEEAIIKMMIIAPLMRALQGGIGSLIPGAGGISIPKFASGTNFAPGGLSLVGERGPELVNLPRGSQVIPNHQLPNGGGNTSIVINNNTPAQVQAREVMDGRGNRSIQVTVDEMVASSMSRPGSATRGALRNNFGASPVGVRR